MLETLEILKYILPSGVVFITAYFLLKIFLNSQEEIQKKALQTQIEELRLQIKHEEKRDITPIRLQASERMVLFLERISPQSLIFRVQKPGQTVMQLQTALHSAIRSEYEHNMAQQLYISKETWGMLRTAKEEVVKLVNTASSGLKPTDNSIELSRRVFELSIENNKNTERAISMLKKDIQKLF
ncbi:MAG: hypothetical protein DRI86_06045 [Bacteroidetes bacterium]|nr:MAG: hypothetical protein DRI86_06045 [Bacteroidota bacterium]